MYSHVNLNIFFLTLKSLLAYYVRLHLMYLGSWCSFTSDLIQTTQLPVLARNTTRAAARVIFLPSMLTLFDQNCWSLNSILLSKLLGSVWWKEERGKGNCCGPARGERERERNTCNREIVQSRTPQGRKTQVGQRRAAALWHPVCAPPPSRLHYDSFSVRVKVRPDSSAAVYGYVCFLVCMCAHVGVSQHPYKTDGGGGDGNEESQTETRQRDLSVGSESLCFVDEAGRHPEVLGGRVRLIPHAWLEVWFLVRFYYKVRPEGFWRLIGCCNLHFYVFLLEYLNKRKTSN